MKWLKLDDYVHTDTRIGKTSVCCDVVNGKRGIKVREKTVERKLVNAVHALGGLALKFVSPGMAGVPDRLILLPGGWIAFCEVKAQGQKPRPLQMHRMEQLRELGFQVYVIDGVEQIREILGEIKKTPLR